MTACPIEQGELYKIKYIGVEVEECRKCQGIWLSCESVKELYNKFYLEVPAKIYHEFEPNINHRSWPSKIRCPNDQVILTTYEFKNIEIDICEKCKGLWLDKGEIDKIRLKVTGKDRFESFIEWVVLTTIELIMYR